jgi:hypothetical protein
VVGQYGDASGRIALLEDPDLADRVAQVVAGIDDEQDRSVSRRRRQDKLVDSRGRSHDTEVRRAKDAGQALSK